MVRRILLAVALGFALPSFAAAAVPQSLSLQGMLRTSSGQPVNGTVNLKLTLFDAASGGTAVHSQTFNGASVTSGAFDVVLGPLPGALLDQAPSLWVEAQVTGESPLPRQPLLSVPYAIRTGRADVAATASGLDCVGCVTGDKVASASITGAQIQDGSVASADVGFPWAEGTTKGGAAANLECTGCVGPVDLAANAVTGANVADGTIAPVDVSFNYAGSATKGGDATGLACTGCVGSSDLGANLALSGDLSVSGSVLACTAGTIGCGVRLSSKGGLYDPGDGAMNLQANAGLRVRNLANGAWAPIEAGATAINGNAIVTGAVGIGTGTPGQSLHVNGTGMRVSRAGASNLGSMDFVIDSSPTASSLRIAPVASTQTPDVSFLRGDGQVALHVETSNGRIGVGTAAPGAELDIVGNARARDAGGAKVAELSGDGALEITRDTTPYIDLKTGPAEDYDVRLQVVSDGLAIRTGGNGATAERLTITAAGRVGVGTTTPATTLDVNGGAVVRGAMSLATNKLLDAYIPLGRHGQGGYNVVGYHYDSLIAADRKFITTASSGMTDGTIANLFDGQSNTSLVYPQSAGPVTVVVDMGMQHYWYAVSAYFPYDRSIKGIKIEKFHDPNSGNGWSCSDPAMAWATVAETTSFTAADFYTTTNLGNGICKLRFTFSGTVNNADGKFHIGELAAWRQAHYGDDGLYVTRTGTGGNRIYTSLSIEGQLRLDSGVDLGDGANDDLTAADVGTLTGGGNADALHTHTGLGTDPKPWTSVGSLNDIFSTINTYPFASYEYGVNYNAVFGEIHEITCSGWNQGYRCITARPYLVGDYQSQYALGGAAWFWNTHDTWDNACTSAGAWFHQYFAIGSGSGWASGIAFIGGNGCSIPGLYVRAR